MSGGSIFGYVNPVEPGLTGLFISEIVPVPEDTFTAKKNSSFFVVFILSLLPHFYFEECIRLNNLFELYIYEAPLFNAIINSFRVIRVIVETLDFSDRGNVWKGKEFASKFIDKGGA